MTLNPKSFKLLILAMVLTAVSFVVIVVLLDAVALVLRAFDALYLLGRLAMSLFFIALLVLLVGMCIYYPIDLLTDKLRIYRWRRQQYSAFRVKFLTIAQELCFSGLVIAIFKPFRPYVVQKPIEPILGEAISIWIHDFQEHNVLPDRMKRMDSLKWRYRCLRQRMKSERAIS